MDLNTFTINLHTRTNRQKQGSITIWFVTYMDMQLLPIFKCEQRINYKIKYKCHILISVDSLRRFFFIIMLSLHHYNFILKLLMQLYVM